MNYIFFIIVNMFFKGGNIGKIVIILEGKVV